jgi:hypothetical protein
LGRLVVPGSRGVVAARTEVGAKTNEIPMIDGLDLAACACCRRYSDRWDQIHNAQFSGCLAQRQV